MDILAAIDARRLLRFTYRGHVRTVEPHIYGIDGKGHRALSGYQVGGGSDSGQPVGWKLFHVDDIRATSVLPQQFRGARPDYNPEDPAFAVVIAQLPPHRGGRR